mmetsp:Transcript_19665/g.66501  ORF Transcript_19665/g.66501 Transcript_19665/m.66501 type:complete len:219 (+) Transcript_19665:953-1609(+)
MHSSAAEASAASNPLRASPLCVAAPSKTALFPKYKASATAPSAPKKMALASRSTRSPFRGVHPSPTVCTRADAIGSKLKTVPFARRTSETGTNLAASSKVPKVTAFFLSHFPLSIVLRKSCRVPVLETSFLYSSCTENSTWPMASSAVRRSLSKIASFTLFDVFGSSRTTNVSFHCGFKFRGTTFVVPTTTPSTLTTTYGSDLLLRMRPVSMATKSLA